MTNSQRSLPSERAAVDVDGVKRPEIQRSDGAGAVEEVPIEVDQDQPTKLSPHSGDPRWCGPRRGAQSLCAQQGR